MSADGGSNLMIRVLIAIAFLLLFIWGAGDKSQEPGPQKYDQKHRSTRAEAVSR